MRKHTVIAVCLLGVVMFAVQGCGLVGKLLGGDDAKGLLEGLEATAVAAGEGVATKLPGGQEATVEPPTSAPSETTELQVSPVDNLNSYRSETESKSTVDGTVTDSWKITTEFVKDPPARHMLSVRADSTEFEMIQIGSDSYIRSGDEWTSMSTSSAEGLFPTEGTLDPSSAEGCKADGTETVNGYRSARYVCEYDEGLTALASIGGVVQEAFYKIWVSEEYGVAVRSAWSYTVKDSDGKVSHNEFTTNVTAINEPIEIVPPAGVEKAGISDDIPVMAGAADMMSIMGMTTYRVAGKTVADVATWYEQAMADAGWTYNADESTAGANLIFTKGERKVSVVVNEASGGTDVLIMNAE